jgi:UDP-N-acetyl-D-glucosamine dehydrogenase
MKSLLKQKIVDREARLAVIGLGYVGMPLAVAAAQAGFSVTGLDMNPKLVEDLRKGKHESRDVGSRDLKDLFRQGSLRATTRPGDIGSCDIFCICVPTPLTPNREPVLDYIHDAAGHIAEGLAGDADRERLVILESTSFPGTTHEEVLPVLLSSGARLCNGFHLAFSPERIDPGNPDWGLENTPKLVGGEHKCCTELGVAFYRQFVYKVVPVSSPATAEMAKVLENVYRAVNIALVNELWMLCDRMGLDIWEVIEAASTKPFGYHPFQPGPGLGGHCVPIDPFYLTFKAREFDFSTEFIELAGKINVSMPRFVAYLARRTLNEVSRSLKGARALVLGASYKPGVADIRNSPSLKVMQLLMEEGARVSYHDPYVPEVRVGSKVLKSVPYNASALEKYDLALILTAHPEVDHGLLKKAGIPVVDTRHVLGKS